MIGQMVRESNETEELPTSDAAARNHVLLHEII